MAGPHNTQLAECQVEMATMRQRLAQGDEKFDAIMHGQEKIGESIEQIKDGLAKMRRDHEVRIVKLEESEKSRKLWIGAIGTAVVGLFVEAFWGILKK